MVPQTDEVAQARSNRLSNTWMSNPVVAEIFQALLDFGGSAHRDTVIEHIARRRAPGAPSEGLRQEIVEAFDVHRQRARRSGLPPLMYLPFGEGSFRWALTPRVRQFADRYLNANGDFAEALANFSPSDEEAESQPNGPVESWDFRQRCVQRRPQRAKRAQGEG